MRGRQRGGRGRGQYSGEDRSEDQGRRAFRREEGWGDEREWESMGGQGGSMGGYQGEGYRGRGGFQGGSRGEGYRGRQSQGYQGEGYGVPRGYQGPRGEERGYDEGRFEEGGHEGGYGERGYGRGDAGAAGRSAPSRAARASAAAAAATARATKGTRASRDPRVEGWSATGGEGSYRYGDGELYGSRERSGGMDRSRRGQFTGRGPKGYQRSDERIREDVSEALSRHGDVDASEISVEVRGGEVILTGTVESREAKREAERAIENEPGVKEVQNQLRVQPKQQQGRSQGRRNHLPAVDHRHADREAERSRTRGSSAGVNM